MPPTIRNSKSKNDLTIPAGGTITSNYISLDDKREMALPLVRIPSGFVGVLFPVVSDDPDGTYEVIYDTDGALIYADPSSKITPAWFSLKGEGMYPAHYIKFFSAASTAGTAGTAQSSAVTLKAMGFS